MFTNTNMNGNGRLNNPQIPASSSPSQIKTNVHKRLLETMDLAEARRMPVEQLQAECSRRVDMLLTEQRCPLSAPEKQQLLREVLDEIFGLGPVEEFLRDPMVSDVLVNGASLIYVERFGRLEETTASFRDDAQLIQVIQRIAGTVGRRIDESCPMLDARLADGSRVNAIIPPLAIDGPAMSIRRFGTIPISIEKLVELESLTGEMAMFLEACVRSKINILVSGGTGSGKTTLLNVLSRWIPPGERVVTIEDAAELQMQRKHVIRLETRPPNIEGKGEVTQRDLLRNTLRMRPDRIVIGEVRGAEALDMLQAMNTGHEGSMTTVHANNPRDALRRIENMVSMTGLNFPVTAIRQQTASALDLLIQTGRMTGGRRKVINISEVTGTEGEAICLQDIFTYRQLGIDGEGNARGQFEACGVRPQMLDRLRERGSALPDDLFHRRILSARPANGVPARPGGRHV
ncbi:MAG: tadA capF [Phycisphaerales bacterium]|jgi:pilus assembly protein CpaF|nr:tadA capF [Phycisphaerales bacterium]